jgi:hypothetical protein
VANRRTFGVLPGRSTLGSVRVRTSRFFGVVHAKFVLLVTVVRAHGHARRERFRLHRRAAALARERSRALQGLGEAALYGDRRDVKHAKARVTGLDGELRWVGEELDEIERDLYARVRAVQRDEGSTAAVEPFPEPVPEPGPAPSDPPGPVVVPEPEPVPHEPPGPVIVPEPQPPAEVSGRR